jgi:hypothetical protein
MAMRMVRTQFRLEGFRYKTNPATQELTAVQLLYSGGYTSRLLMAPFETAENMQELRLKEG